MVVIKWLIWYSRFFLTRLAQFFLISSDIKWCRDGRWVLCRMSAVLCVPVQVNVINADCHQAERPVVNCIRKVRESWAEVPWLIHSHSMNIKLQGLPSDHGFPFRITYGRLILLLSYLQPAPLLKWDLGQDPCDFQEGPTFSTDSLPKYLILTFVHLKWFIQMVGQSVVSYRHPSPFSPGALVLILAVTVNAIYRPDHLNIHPPSLKG